MPLRLPWLPQPGAVSGSWIGSFKPRIRVKRLYLTTFLVDELLFLRPALGAHARRFAARETCHASGVAQFWRGFWALQCGDFGGIS